MFTKTKRSVAVFLASLVAVGSITGQTDPNGSTGKLERNLRTHIEYLASDKLEGRRTGEPGAALATEYVAGQFKKLKLKTLAANGSYFQPFPYVTGVEKAATGNEFQLYFFDSGDVEAGDVRPAGFSPNGEVPFTGIFYAGFGIVSADQNRNDYGDLSPKGKIVMVLDGNPDNDNPHSPFARFDARTKALIARDKGAVGLLIVTREANVASDRLARLSFDQTLGEAALPTFVIPRRTAAMVLVKSVNELEQFEKGTAGVPPGSSILTAKFKVNLVKKSTEARNVIGVLPGSDPVLKNEAIVIGAHYDHLGRGGQGSLDVNSTEIHHGADDNASGTAAIIELARQFSAERKNKRTIIFMAFSGEEEGLLGSQYYVNHPLFPLDKTVAMINLDMVGRLNGGKLNIGGIGTSAGWKRTVESYLQANTEVGPTVGASNLSIKSALDRKLKSIGALYVKTEIHDSTLTVSGFAKSDMVAKVIRIAAGAGVPKLNNQLQKFDGRYPPNNGKFEFVLSLSEDGFGPSDHSSFYGKKIPVLFFFTGTHNDYHKPSDTAEKINYEGEAKIINYIAEIVRSVDQNNVRPTYTVAKSSGISGGRSSFNISLGTVPNYADSTDGLLLDGVRDNSPAAKAGILAGDKIVKLAGKDIRNVMDYTYVLGEMQAGTEYQIVVVRGGERLSLKIIPVKR